MPEPLSAADRERLAELFGEAVELGHEERGHFLDKCRLEAEFRAELDSLLAAHNSASEQLQRAPAELLADLEAEPGNHLGERVGPYRLLEELGRGGMGVVYLAERADGSFEQQVAVKCINRALVSPALRERFLRERQILARLEHPHIARLLDGGLTAEGSPYFAMELVHGQPLTTYCQARKLTLHARLDLFAQACGAVSHAHTQLVVHRDLKPSNMLVGEDGNLKLLDFGIARLLDDEGVGASPLTRIGLQPFTPEYAAPEQREGRPATTATDVFSLGVVLAELLTGQRPKPLPEGGVCCSPTDGAGRRLSRDLVAILDQALAADPAARYPSVEALAEDLRRFRAGLPVRALPATLGYRTGKFVRRHRTVVAAVAAATLALVVGLVTSLWQARIAARERDAAERALGRAERVQRFLSDLFEGSNPSSTKGEDLTARQL